MAADDYAIVVGITTYPSHADEEPLAGPENDAREFYAWLTRPDGGAVPPDNIDLILTSDCPPPYADIEDAQPTAERIHKAIRKLQRMGQKNVDAGNPRRVGRRLYMYLAGHGCAAHVIPGFEQTALLMANYDKTWAGSGFHILGQYNADWFFHSSTFDEVFLFMDCCQNLMKVPALDLPYGSILDSSAIDRAGRFRAIGAKWGLKSRERLMPNGEVHGVFTMALLDGLNGKAAENGRITSGSLKSWLIREMPNYLSDEDKLDPEIAKEPEVRDFDDLDITIVEAEDPLFPVRIRIPQAGIGKKLQILTTGKDGDLVTVSETDVTSDLVEVSLKRAVYIVQIIAADLQLQKGVSVGGAEAVDVQL